MTDAPSVMTNPYAMSAPSQQDQRKLADLVRLHLNNARFISCEQEQSLLEAGVTRLNMSLEDSRRTVEDIAESQDATLERDLQRSAQDLLAGLADKKGRVSKADFERAVEFYRTRTNGTLAVEEVRRRVKKLMAQADYKPVRSGLFRSRKWYRSIA